MLIKFPSALILLFSVQSAASLSLFHIAREDVKASADYTQDDLFKSTILNVTNTYRKQHNATALKWNDTLADFAEDWSKKCNFEHSVCGRGIYPFTTILYTYIYITGRNASMHNIYIYIYIN